MRPAREESAWRVIAMMRTTRPATQLGRRVTKEARTVLWAIVVILVALWLLGLIGSIGGGLIHLLLVLAVIVVVVQLLSGRRAA